MKQMLKNKSLLLILSFFFIETALAQDQADSNAQTNVVVKKDWRLDALVRKQVEAGNKRQILKTKLTKEKETAKETAKEKDPSLKVISKTRVSMQGYRIQVINTIDRNAAIAAKSKMMQMFPQHKVYMPYRPPYFLVRLGNFKSKAEAEPVKKQISKVIASTIYIIPDVIELRVERTEEVDN
jgi:hypothetical protein